MAESNLPSYEEVADALLAVLDGCSAWYEIHECTGMSVDESHRISDMHSKLLKSRCTVQTDKEV